jgi:arylsulfatase A
MANHDQLPLSRRGFLQAGALGLVGLGVGSMLSRLAFAQGAAPAGGRPPNIIFIIVDDLGIADVSCCGSDRFYTPNIDALAKSGTRFQTCYSTPMCGPSRCQCLTGRYPFRTGLNTNRSQNAVSPEREVMTPTILKSAGYATALVGKWGQICLGPGEWGFADYLTFDGNGQYWPHQRGRAGLSYCVNGSKRQLEANEYLPDVMHRYLVDYIQRHRDMPFFVHYSMSHIHWPILPTPDSRPGEKSEAALYSDNIAYVDKLVGELIMALERMKLRERTLIVFTGDNGTAQIGIEAGATIGGRRLFGQKEQLNEGGCRVPLVVNWPGVAPEAVVNHDLVDFSDFLPTFAELAAAAIPAKPKIDGQSFAAQIRGQKGTPREWVYCELAGRAFVRDGRYKLTSGGELLDLRDAPFEEAPVGTPMPEEAKASAKRLQAVLDEHQPAPEPPWSGPCGLGKHDACASLA